MDTGNDAGKSARAEEQAAALLRRIIAIDENHIGARALLALLFEKRRMYREAIVQYRRIIGEEESILAARANLALLFRRMGLHDRSKAELNTAGQIADSAGLKKEIIKLIREEVE
jgi:cytochrome c-type biogenesis protein CcmH/NrfG